MSKTRKMFGSGDIRNRFRFENLEMREMLSATVPMLPAIVAPASHPTLPAGFDIFTPQGVTGTGANGAPGIAQFTQSGNANDILAISLTHPTALPASSNSSDTQFFTYGQTTSSNGTLVNDTIEQLGSGVASVSIDSGNTPNSMYFLWAKNADGYSSAVAVNKANAWWVGPNEASSGQTVSIYGQNLTFSPTDGLSWVYITQAGSNTGQWATVTSANPYKVDFTVPAGLAPGNYQVWVHNGHGGEYGWSSPVTLTVAAPAAVSTKVFNVLSYGAIGNGVTDSTAAFQAAMNAAAAFPGATVYVPAGHYVISQVYTRPNMNFVGAGAGQTVLVETTSGTVPTTMLWLNSNLQVSNMTLDSNNVAIQDVVFGRNLSNIHFNNVTFNGHLTGNFDIHIDTLVSFQNCNFIGSSNFLGTASQVFIDHCNFYATNDAGEMLYSWGGNGISITNCTVQDLNNSNSNSGAGWGTGRFFVGNNLWGSGSNTYVANNNTIAMGVRPVVTDQNQGEQLLWETEPLVSGGTYIGSTANTVTYTGLPNTVGPTDYAIVVAGDGIGEYVPISSYNAVTGVITLAGTWTATPDSTSVVRVGQIINNVVVYDNTIQGKGITNTGSNGVQFWGNVLNGIIDSNTISNTRYGITDLASAYGGDVIPLYFTTIQNNTITGTQDGMLLVNNAATNQIGNVGTVVRFNHITLADPNSIGFWLKDNDSLGTPFDVILEGNTVAGANVGIGVNNYGTAATYLTLVNNSFASDSLSAAGSMGLNVAQSLNLTESGNSFTGFAQITGGTLTPITLAPFAVAPQNPLSNTLGGGSATDASGGGSSTSVLSGGSTSTTGSIISTPTGSGSGSTTTGSTSSTTTTTPSHTTPSPVRHHTRRTMAAAMTNLFATTTNDLKNTRKTPGNDAEILAA